MKALYISLISVYLCKNFVNNESAWTPMFQTILQVSKCLKKFRNQRCKPGFFVLAYKLAHLVPFVNILLIFENLQNIRYKFDTNSVFFEFLNEQAFLSTFEIISRIFENINQVFFCFRLLILEQLFFFIISLIT